MYINKIIEDIYNCRDYKIKECSDIRTHRLIEKLYNVDKKKDTKEKNRNKIDDIIDDLYK